MGTQGTTRKCLEEGHIASECENDWTCKGCGKVGHKYMLDTCTGGMFSVKDQHTPVRHVNCRYFLRGETTHRKYRRFRI